MSVSFYVESQILIYSDIPNIDVSVQVVDEVAVAGESFTLKCVVSGVGMIESSIEYEWRKQGRILKNEIGMAYTFTPTAEENGTSINCTATVNIFMATTIRMGSSTIRVLGEF